MVQFCNNYLVVPSQKNPPFGHSKNGKWFFRPTKMKTSLGNIVCYSNMHPCAQHEIILTNYVMNVAIRLIIWLESHASSRMIARLWEHFLKIITVLQVFYFSWKPSHCVIICDQVSRKIINLYYTNYFKKCSQKRAIKCEDSWLSSQMINLMATFMT